MALQGATTLNLPYATGDTSKPVAKVDGLLVGEVNNGVRFLADLGFGPCYPGGPRIGRPAPGNPANGAPIYDLAARADGGFVKGANTVTFAGGGFDFSSVAAVGHYSSMPASVAADLWTPYSGASQRYLAFEYVRLPAKADWRSATGITPCMCFGTLLYNTPSPELFVLSMGLLGGARCIDVRRQTNGATIQQLTTAALSDASFGTLAQLGVWRTATAFAVRVKTAAETLIVTASQGSDNVTDFSALTGKVGVTPLLTGGVGTEVKYRSYRFGVVNLARWALDPVATLDADWDRTQARIAASAAGNGGVSLIFN